MSGGVAGEQPLGRSRSLALLLREEDSLEGSELRGTNVDLDLKGLTWDFPGGPGGKTPLSQCRGPWDLSLVGEIKVTCYTQLKILYATIKKRHSQI